MHISRDRFVGAMLPLGKPLPLVTSGNRDHEFTFGGGARMLGHAVDCTITALTRPLAAPGVAAAGAFKRAKAADKGTVLASGAAVAGVVSGFVVGLAGAATGLGEAVIVDGLGGVSVLSLRTCKLAVQGLEAGVRLAFGADL